MDETKSTIEFRLMERRFEKKKYNERLIANGIYWKRMNASTRDDKIKYVQCIVHCAIHIVLDK